MTLPALVDARTLERVQTASARLGGARPCPPRVGRVHAGELYSAWEQAYAQHGECVVEDVSRNVGLDDLGVFGFVARTASDVLAALEAAVRYYPLITGDRTWALESSAKSVVLHLLSPLERGMGRRVSDEAAMAQFLTCMTSTTSTPIRVREIMLNAQSLAPSVLRRFCPRPPTVSHGCAIVFERAAFDTPTTHAHAPMHAHFVALAEAELERLRPATWTAQTESALRDALAAGRGLSPLAHVVDSLGVSRRTLQRRLRGESTTLQGVHDEVRRDIAESMLRDGVTVENTALAVGFADSRAFTRAFIRWTGKSPSVFRQSLLR